MPHHSYDGWLYKLKSHKPLFEITSKAALLEHRRRTEGQTSARKAKKARLDVATSAGLPSGSGSIQPSASTPEYVEETLPSWAKDVTWPTRPSKPTQALKGGFKYTDDEISFAKAWVRIKWMLDPTISCNAMAHILAEVVRVHGHLQRKYVHSLSSRH